MRDEDEAVPENAEPDVVAAPAPEKRTVEQWATDKGMLPAMLPSPQPPIASGGQLDPRMGRAVHTVRISNSGRLPPRTNPNLWKFNGAKAGERWPVGLMVTEAEFDAAILRVTHGNEMR